VKSFSTYQALPGEPMTERDKMEVESKFWNKGKWDNFVLPFLPEDCSEQTLVDMGCNSGLFLRLAQDKGFLHVVGVDSDKRAVERGIAWRDKNWDIYKILNLPMEKSIDELPVADYTVLANAHYYFKIDDWLDYLDKLRYKTRYCIIVTAEKRHTNRCWASADLTDIRAYFKDWYETGFVNELPIEGEVGARKLWGLCFKSPYIERVSIDSLDCGNHIQDRFYEELDRGTEYNKTRYYRILKPYRKKWSEEMLNNYMLERMEVYEDLKENGLKRPLIVNSENLILDGNHRYCMMKTLDYKSIIVRKT